MIAHPLDEVFEHSQAHRPAFLRVKLRSPDMLAHDYTAKGRAVMRDGGHALLILRLDIVGVGKVEVGIRRNTGENGQILREAA